MTVNLTSPGANVYLTVTSPGGSVLASAQFGEQSLDRFLPETGDYKLEVSTIAGTPQTTFTLVVSIVGAQQPTVQSTLQPTFQPTTPPNAQRISFAPGTSSAQVSGHIVGTTIDRYLLAAAAGQSMQVSVSSPTNNVFLSVVAPSGAMLASAPAGAKSFSGALPQTGDYTFRVSTSYGTAQADYTLVVSVSNTPLPTSTPLPATSAAQPTAIPQPGVQRISFAAGATSASVSGPVSGGVTPTYLVGAGSGQRMTINLSSPGGNVYMTVTSPSGATLASASLGQQSLDHFLSESGDYTITDLHAAGDTRHELHAERVDYGLGVSTLA